MTAMRWQRVSVAAAVTRRGVRRQVLGRSGVMVVLSTDDLFKLTIVEEYSPAAAALLDVDSSASHCVHEVLALWTNHRVTLPSGLC
jgi:hypothetical protein